MDLYWHRIKQQPVLLGVAAALLLLLAIVSTYYWRSQAEAVEQQLPQAVSVEVAAPRVVAHAAGAVVKPGLYELPAYSRVADLIAAAGGPSSEADLNQLNLAAPLADGTRVYVPVEGEAPLALEPGIDLGPLNLNTATQIQLETLIGVGPSTAAAIIEWREQFGPFASVEDLLEVPGIGPAKLARLADDVVAG